MNYEELCRFRRGDKESAERKTLDIVYTLAKARDEAEATATRLRGLLSGIEWVVDPDSGERFCPHCLSWQKNGHAADCELAAEVGDG